MDGGGQGNDAASTIIGWIVGGLATFAMFVGTFVLSGFAKRLSEVRAEADARADNLADGLDSRIDKLEQRYIELQRELNIITVNLSTHTLKQTLCENDNQRQFRRIYEDLGSALDAVGRNRAKDTDTR